MTDTDLGRMTERDMAQGYVEGILNDHDLDLIPELFANSFIDRNPLFAPKGGVDDLKVMVRFLAAPGTDIHFTLEDTVADRHALAYRMFGQGTFTLRDLGRFTANAQTRRQALAPVLQGGPEEGPPEQHPLYKAMSRTRSERARINITLEVVGWFRLRSGRFIERWGGYKVDW